MKLNDMKTPKGIFYANSLFEILIDRNIIFLKLNFYSQEYIEFKRQCLEMTVEKLLEQFVLSKYTGLEKPGK